ncbi:MAG: GNAT family N-acetyltransferase [Eudoraea sp.]|uniref:GNAT family N-acetyltransferase n=1 Tax=Eudoraea sp. TaxID=1979955 RepID=UPI0032668872
MIRTLNHKNQHVAHAIRSVFQASYAIEAKLLNATDFPPLKRTVKEFLDSKNAFYGYYVEDTLAGVVEVKADESNTHIQSLVVHPNFFRQRIGSALVQFVLDTYTTKTITVETGLANEPAKDLYYGFHFRKVREYDTTNGIRKIAFLLPRA